MNVSRLTQTFLAFLFLAVLAVPIYVNTLDSPFVLDDGVNILGNSLIRMNDITPEAVVRVFKSKIRLSVYRPVVYLSFAFNYYFQRFDVTGYHLVNLAIHMVTALLVFILTRQTMGLLGKEDSRMPFLTAALWMVNPIHTQTVTYIDERANCLAAMFFLLAMVCYIRARLAGRQKNRWTATFLLVACGLSGLLGLGSKQTTATLPVMIFLYEGLFLQNLNRAWLKKSIGWLGGLMILLSIIVFIGGGLNPAEKLANMYDNQRFTIAQRLLTQPGVVIYYATLLLFPHPDRIMLMYDPSLISALTEPLVVAFSLLAITSLMLTAFYRAGQHRLLSFCILWFLGNLVIESSIIGLPVIYNHRTYLPSVFPFIGLTFFLYRIKPKIAAVTILCAAIGISGFWTYQRNSTWQNALTLWEDNAKKAPGQALCYNNIGCAYLELNDFKTAAGCFEKALTVISKSKGAAQYPLFNLGMIMLHLNKPEKAVDYFTKAAGRDPFYAEAHLRLGLALQRLGRIDDAIKSYKRAMAINPYLEEACNNLGVALFLKGDIAGAITMFNKALAIYPGYRDPQSNLAKIQQSLDQHGEEIVGLEEKVATDPDNPQISFRLGQACQAVGMTDRAITWYERALSFDSANPLYLYALANAYAAAGRLSQALESYQKIAAIAPDNATAQYNMACLYARLYETDMAVEALRQAIRLGYDRWDHLKSDRDLESIHGTEYYRNLIGMTGK